MRCDTDFDAGACTVIIIPTRLLLMKKTKGPRTLRSRPPINACPDATPSDARLNAASAPKVIVIAKTPVHGGFTQGKGGVPTKTSVGSFVQKNVEITLKPMRRECQVTAPRQWEAPRDFFFLYLHSDQCPASAMRRMAFRVFSWEPNAVRRK